jgi:hypothetical protein
VTVTFSHVDLAFSCSGPLVVDQVTGSLLDRFWTCQESTTPERHSMPGTHLIWRANTASCSAKTPRGGRMQNRIAQVVKRGHNRNPWCKSWSDAPNNSSRSDSLTLGPRVRQFAQALRIWSTHPALLVIKHRPLVFKPTMALFSQQDTVCKAPRSQ